MVAYTARVYWSKREGWMIDTPNRPDGHLLSAWMSGRMTFDQLVDELKKRGYDTSTLRLSVKRLGIPEGGE